MGDYFSVQAADYLRYRPDYPAALYQRLLPRVSNRDRAWDCGTGNGQVAAALAPHFSSVVATDLSANQIAQANAANNVSFAVATAEASGLEDQSVDLITVGQAIHWFDFEAFWAECQRVARPGAVLAFWTYGLASAGLPDHFEQHYHSNIVGPYWPPGREHVDALYKSIKPPFRPVADENLELKLDWDLEHYLGYLGSWSATQKYREARGEDPLLIARQQLQAIWGEGEREINWPLVLKVYEIPNQEKVK